MLNGLQLACHLPLFFTPFPANASFFLSFIINVATFDLLPGTVLPLFFDFPDKPAFNQGFQDTGYGSMYPLLNLGTCFLLFNIYIFQVLIWAITGCFKDCSDCAQRWHSKYHKSLFWGSIIRLLFEGYLELCLSVFVGLTDLEWSGENYNSSVLFSNIFALCISVLLVGLPVFILVWYQCKVDNLEDDAFIESYGDIYDGLVLSGDKETRRIALFYPFWFVMRRLTFSLVCILAPKELWLQIAVNFVVSMVNLCYLVKYKPFEDKRMVKLEIMNEATNFILLYHVILFTNFVPDPETRYGLGWSFIFFTTANMMVHLSLLCKETYHSMKESCGKKCRKKIEEEPADDVVKTKELSVIAEDEFESNFSSKDSDKVRDEDKLSDSDWTSKLGGTEKGGYNLQNIRWKDLGRKYIVKKGRKSMIPDLADQSDFTGQ